MNYRAAVEKNLMWFKNSGVMIPSTGEWGVAERIAVLAGNEASEKILRHFPAWTLKDDYAIVEPRRSDCCFEAALMFLLAHDFYNDSEYRATGENILDFLYFRSGMLNRYHETLQGTWWWSHIFRDNYHWFDDNGWVAALQILIGKRWPDLDRKYNCVMWGVKLADVILEGFNRCFDPAKTETNSDVMDPEKIWYGRLTLPHWGMPPISAFMAAYTVEAKPEYFDAAKRYSEYVLKNLDIYTVSELGYILIVMPLAMQLWPEESVFAELNNRVVEVMAEKSAAAGNGNLPSEHYEAPKGTHLVDTIYTVNWALLGFVNLARYTGNAEHVKRAGELADLLVTIQDRGPEPQFAGCWRGMYDLNAQNWGGGDCFEGGANSIYTGWTNAPISIALMLLEHKLSFADIIKG